MTRSCVIKAPSLVQVHVAQYLRRLWHRDMHGPPRRIGIEDLNIISKGFIDKQTGMAISGGVDSMALAALCKEARSEFLFTGFIVDHGVRLNSSDEAAKVADELRKIGVDPRVLKLDWKTYGCPTDLTNFEAVARRLRYQAMGKACYGEGIRSLLVGHHADDQAETVLTRIVSGYLGAGLAGIQTEAGIPECTGIYGVDGSGGSSHCSELGEQDDDSSTRLMIEYGGVNICRPLLPFTKDQLIQTCRDEDVRWFEDPTNADRMLTMRNTIRHLHERAMLPAALHRSRLCLMAGVAQDKTVSVNAEVDRLFDTMDIELDLRLGSVTFAFDRDMLKKPSSESSTTMHRVKLALLRKLMQLVTNRNILLQDLESAADVVFSEDGHFQAVQVGKVNMQPAKSKDHDSSSRRRRKRLVLSRQKPNISDVRVTSEFAVLAQDNHDTRDSTEWSLWDDRYWIRLHSKGNPESQPSLHISVQFFTPRLLGNVRKSLDKGQRKVLDHHLEVAKEYGIKWTLPVFVAQESGHEHVISLPSLRWENPAFRKWYVEKMGDAQLHFRFDIRYKSIEFKSSDIHRIIS